MLQNNVYQKNIHNQKIRSVAAVFYIVAVFQMVLAYIAWSRGSVNPFLAQSAMFFAGLDVVIGIIFVALGYFASKREPWAFVIGLILYAIRAALQFFQFFSPITLVIRVYLLFRIYQGWQACVAFKQAELLNKSQRSVELTAAVKPTATVASTSSSLTSVAWTPARSVERPTTKS